MLFVDDPLEAWQINTGVFLFGATLESELEQIDGSIGPKTKEQREQEKTRQRAIEQRRKLLQKWGVQAPDTPEKAKPASRYADPAAMRR